jgi:hypothetical protein
LLFMSLLSWILQPLVFSWFSELSLMVVLHIYW